MLSLLNQVGLLGWVEAIAIRVPVHVPVQLHMPPWLAVAAAVGVRYCTRQRQRRAGQLPVFPDLPAAGRDVMCFPCGWLAVYVFRGEVGRGE